MSVREEFSKLGCIQCDLDPAMFYLKEKWSTVVMLMIFYMQERNIYTV